MPVLYINPLRTTITLTILDGVKVINTVNIPRGDDFWSFPETLISTIREYAITTIWTITGPGAFTRMRIVSLTLSTLILTEKIEIKWAHFFELISWAIPTIQANQEEYIILDESIPRLLNKWVFPDWNYSGYGNKNDFTDGKVFIEYEEDWCKICEIFSELPPQERVIPIYLKEPHITWSKKNTYHSSGTMNR